MLEILLSPDDAKSSGDPATDENIESGETDSPSSSPGRSADRDMYVSRGIQIGIDRVLKKLGFSDIDTAKDEISKIRTRQSNTEKSDSPDRSGSKDESVLKDKIREITKENHAYKREMKNKDDEIKRLTEQSDEARLMKLRAIALENGVGKGRQLDAFVKLYGDDVSFDSERNLVVLTKLSDGSMEPMGESIEDFVRKALEKDPYLKPFDNYKGSGSRAKPSSKSDPSNLSPLAQSVFGKSGSSGRSMIFGRRNSNDSSK